MATEKQESTVERAERELNQYEKLLEDSTEGFQQEYKAATDEWNDKVEVIQRKYKLRTIREEVENRKYYLKVLKGGMPDNSNSKNASTLSIKETIKLYWAGKWEAGYQRLGKSLADKVTLKEIKLVMFELYPHLTNMNAGAFMTAFYDYKRKNKSK